MHGQMQSVEFAIELTDFCELILPDDRRVSDVINFPSVIHSRTLEEQGTENDEKTSDFFHAI